ncbi:MAG: hypothetical protein M1376_20605 [Planctomycetes bacterium]|nr:hypothetical protein [Planctomycetota bacterium]
MDHPARHQGSRTLRDRCKQRVQLADSVIRRLGIPARELARATFYGAKDCPACGGAGYKGRRLYLFF